MAALHMVISDFFHLRLQPQVFVAVGLHAFPTGPSVSLGGGGGGGGGGYRLQV